MKSDFVKNGLSGLSGINSWLVDGPYNKLRIVGRNPEQGFPAAGIPFSVDVQIATDNNEHWYDFACPDLFVVARDAHTNRIWASKYIVSSGTFDCKGTGTLLFDSGFAQNNTHSIQFELYDDSVQSVADIKPSLLVGASQPVNFNIGQAAGRGSGVYGGTEDSSLEKIGNVFNNSGLFGGLNSTLNKVLLIGGVGAGVYFLSPFFPEIKDGFQHLSGNIKTKIK